MGIDALLVIRFVKLCAVCALASGIVGAFAARALEDRRALAYFAAAPGLVVAWGAGLATALARGVSPLAPWIAGAVIASTISVNLALWAVAREGRRSRGAGAVAIAGIAVAIALMVWKPVLG